jgi:fermentation-respiration switch protein FrsA (DUF1100 family)
MNRMPADRRIMRRYVVRGLAVSTAAGLVALTLVTQSRAHELITNSFTTRQIPTATPAAYQMAYEDVSVRTRDGLRLVGWYVRGSNGAMVMLQHGYKDSRSIMLDVAAVLVRHGYGVLIGTVRAHDASDGERISFGHEEMQDLAAWEQYLRSRYDLDPDRIGIFGHSMGGSMAIQFAAQNPRIKAVVTNCAFSSLRDTIGTSVRFFTGLPEFPFAPMIVFWAEREGGFRASEIDATKWIRRISPRPVLLMQGGLDVVISPDSGQRLFDAAGEPRELWFDPDIGHVEFLAKRLHEFEQRVVGFYDKYLLGK